VFFLKFSVADPPARVDNHMELAQINIGEKFFGSGAASQLQKPEGIASLVSLFLNISFVIAGLILLFYFILGGIGIIGSAGQDDPQKLEQAKKTATSALIGFIIVFASYWIVKLIRQLIGMPNLI
jgi:hypothetical protein